MNGKIDAGASSGSGLFTSSTGSNPNDYLIKQDFYRLQILYNRILLQLSPAITLYNEGSFEDFMSSISEDELLYFSTVLNNDSIFYIDDNVPTVYADYNKQTVQNYRESSNSIINIIKQAMTEYIKIQNLQSENTQLKSYKEILESPQLLRDYLENMQQTSFFFSASATFNTQIELKPWYRTYLELYGAPNDGVFDSTLLANIVEELINSGEITEEDILY